MQYYEKYIQYFMHVPFYTNWNYAKHIGLSSQKYYKDHRDHSHIFNWHIDFHCVHSLKFIDGYVLRLFKSLRCAFCHKISRSDFYSSSNIFTCAANIPRQ